MLKLGYVRNSIEKSSSTTAALQPSASKASLSAKVIMKFCLILTLFTLTYSFLMASDGTC